MLRAIFSSFSCLARRSFAARSLFAGLLLFSSLTLAHHRVVGRVGACGAGRLRLGTVTSGASALAANDAIDRDAGQRQKPNDRSSIQNGVVRGAPGRSSSSHGFRGASRRAPSANKPNFNYLHTRSEGHTGLDSDPTSLFDD
jgi:hypothetical protein